MGQKPAPSQELPLMSGEDTTDLVLCANAAVRTPSDAAQESKGATVYYRIAVINFYDNGHLKPREVNEMAINNPAYEGTGTLGFVVRCTT